MSVSRQIERALQIERRLLELSADIERAGRDMVADIAQRVINEGKNDTGGKFSPYSTRPVPAYLYFGRSVNAGGEAKVRAAAKKRQGVSYRDFREFNSRPTNIKNFSFTNEMWRDFGVIGVTKSGRGVYVLEIGGKSEQSADKIGWNSAGEGRSIIAPDADEKARFYAELFKAIFN